jgi:hypothetical protein
VRSARQRASSGRRDDLVPYGAVIAALLAIVFLLPSALRPPQQPPPPSQELSPDAPPDNTDSIISSFRRGQSGTGEGVGAQGEETGGVVEAGGPAAPPAPAPPAAACPFGYGNPPRQTFSIYSAPCAGTFTGDNGGDTANGVTATEIHLVVPGGTEGFAPDEPPPGDEDDWDRTWRIYQKWLNSHYQFYGRKVRLYKLDPGGDEETRKAKAARFADEIHVFAALGQGATNGIELARRKIIYFGEVFDQWDDSFTEPRRPYLWTWHGSATLMRKLTAEYVCGRLANRPAKFAGPAYSGSVRKFGAIYDDGDGKKDGGEEIKRFVKERCGVDVDPVIGVQGLGDTQAAASSFATAVSRFVQAGVTSVIVPLNWLLTGALTSTAKSHGYVPEWIIAAEGLNDYNVQARTYDQSEWVRHAFGISGAEIEEDQDLAGVPSFHDGYRAYKEMDPGNDPHRGPFLFFPMLQQIANGIQMAGPNLTPESFERGLFSIPLREGPPNWAQSGGYRPGNYGHATAVGEIWWDPSAIDSAANPGAYRWTRNGLRWKLGQLPPGETTVFEEGIATRPADWASSY